MHMILCAGHTQRLSGITQNMSNPLADIFASNTIVRLLSLFLLNPERAYYQQELMRETGGTLRPIQVALDKLVAADLVSRREEGRHVYYQTITANPVYRDLRSVFEKSFALRDVLAEALMSAAASIDVAFVYGSAASGSQRPSSDIDLFVVGNVGRVALSEALSHAEDALKREVNVAIYTPERLRDALVSGDPFVSEVLSGAHVWILGGDDELERMAR